MAVVVTADIPAGTAEMDDAMVKALNIEQDRPKGSRARISGPTEKGWRILSVWDSREDFDAFVRDRLGPALEAAGRPRPDFQFWPVERVIIS